MLLAGRLEVVGRKVRSDEERALALGKILLDPGELVSREEAVPRAHVGKQTVVRPLEPVENHEVCCAERSNADVFSRDRRLLETPRPCLGELAAAVVVTHAEDKLDARVLQSLQDWLGDGVVRGMSVKVREVAEVDHATRQRTHREHFVHERNKPLRRVLCRAGVFAAHVRIGDYHA